MVKIGLEFNTLDEAIVALAKLTAGKKAAIVADTPLVPRESPTARAEKIVAAMAPLEPLVLKGSKAARKGRADKGQKRGPHGGAKPEAGAVEEPSSSAGGIPADSSGSGTVPTESSSPAVTPTDAAAPAPTPTLEDAQKKLEALFNTKGLPAALKVLETFGKKRVQDVPADKRAEFIVLVDKELA